MEATAEVARIKAGFAARNASWMSTIRARLAAGPATTRQLAGLDFPEDPSQFDFLMRRGG